jgi:CubicO group peptidase (beta-lactamase class C family)
MSSTAILVSVLSPILHLGLESVIQDPGREQDLARASAEARVILESLREVEGIPGLAVAVGLGDRLVFSEGFGWSDVENQVPVTARTRFRIGSVSKPLTAAALAVLVREGKIDLDAGIRDYVPSFPEKEHRITVRQLAGHLGGIRHYRAGGFFNREQFDTVAASLRVFSGDPLVHEPGSSYRYSTYGYVLLSAAMAKVAGRPYLELMQERVFGPLGMKSTGPEVAEAIIPGRAEFYDRTRGGDLVNAPSENYSYKWAGGGFLSTAEDLVTFGLAMSRGELVGSEMRDLLFTSQKNRAGEETGYGMGWRPDRDWRERKVVHHGGSSEGARAFVLVYPEEQLAIALLANFSSASILEGEAECLAQLFLPGETMGLAAPDGLDGLYAFSATVDGNELKGHLSLTRSGTGYRGWISKFYSDNATILHASSAGDQVRFVVSTRSGLPNLWLRFEGDSFAGSWGWERPRWPFRGTKVED